MVTQRNVEHRATVIQFQPVAINSID